MDLICSSWIKYQRTVFHKDQLEPERVELLYKIGFDFDKPDSAAAPPTIWEVHFKELEWYNDKNGDCNVPQVYAPNPALAKWVASQRVKYKRGGLKQSQIGENILDS